MKMDRQRLRGSRSLSLSDLSFIFSQCISLFIFRVCRCPLFHLPVVACALFALTVVVCADYTGVCRSWPAASPRRRWCASTSAASSRCVPVVLFLFLLSFFPFRLPFYFSFFMSSSRLPFFRTSLFPSAHWSVSVRSELTLTLLSFLSCDPCRLSTLPNRARPKSPCRW